MFLMVKNVKKYFGNLCVLQGVNFELEANNQCVIQGASGSGKSTLLHLMAGLEPVSQGKIIIGGQNIDSLGDDQLAYYRNRYVGLVFQFHYLLPSLNCLENIFLPARISKNCEMDKVEKRIFSLAKELGVEHCLTKSPYEISGGEQQRINIIRALSLAPKLLLCDEPTGNLDSVNSDKVIQIIKELAKEFSSTLIVVTHNKEMVTRFEFEALMKDGLLQRIK